MLRVVIIGIIIHVSGKKWDMKIIKKIYKVFYKEESYPLEVFVLCNVEKKEKVKVKVIRNK